jgi:hypothetical protein
VNLLIKRTYKQSIIILLLISIFSAFVEWKKLPISIIVGGILGLANLGGIARGVEGLIRKHRSSGKLIFFSMFRLTILTAILTILVIYKLVNIFGILIGFTVVSIAIIKEGLRLAREQSED